MDANEHRLPEAIRRELIKASFRSDGTTKVLVLTRVEDEDPRNRVLALRAASRHDWLTHEQWRAALGDREPAVRREAATLLARMKLQDPDLLVVLIGALADPDALVVDAAAFALGELEDPSAVEALITVAQNHDDARCRESAVAALGAIGDERAVAVVIAALNDKPPIRRRAVVALANFEGPEVEEALTLASTDRDWQVRAAVDQLGLAESNEP